MDTGMGHLAPITPERAKELTGALNNANTIDTGIFHVGQELIINGSFFRVQSLSRKGMKLKILPRKFSGE